MALDPNVTIYLRDIARAPLLSAEEEQELARRLIRQNDPAARDLLVQSNLRLVVKIARTYCNHSVSMLDLIEEGNLGLLKAVEGFNPEMKIRFSTYASWWIKQAIRRSLFNSTQPVHVPGYMVEMIGHWKRAVTELRERLGRDPTVETLSRHMELPAKKVRMIIRAVRVQQRPAEVREGEMLPAMAERAGMTPANEAMGRDEICAMRMLLTRLDPREARILRMRFGLDNEEPRTLSQVGQRIGLTRERVRQIECHLLGRLKRQLSATRVPATIPAETVNGKTVTRRRAAG